MYCMNKRRETLGWKLIIYVGGFDIECMSGRIEPSSPPPPQANLLPHPLAQKVEKDIVKEGTETHPLKIWGMML